MRFFISHKQEDSFVAKLIYSRIIACGEDAYLDLLDNKITDEGKELTEHIKRSLNSCTDILVVMSEKTKLSQWVPFEVGMSAQIDMPTATYLSREVNLPDFLEYWPRLRQVSDIEAYIKTKKQSDLEARSKYGLNISSKKKEATEEFYRKVKAELK